MSKDGDKAKGKGQKEGISKQGKGSGEEAFVTGTRQDLKARAFQFATAVLQRHKRLSAGGPAHAHMTQQLFEAASSIGAMLEEGEVASSRRDMAAKHTVALREARESNYWLRLLSTDPLLASELEWLVDESRQFVAMLTTSVRKLRNPPS
jgi:four helix bundle protein